MSPPGSRRSMANPVPSGAQFMRLFTAQSVGLAAAMEVEATGRREADRARSSAAVPGDEVSVGRPARLFDTWWRRERRRGSAADRHNLPADDATGLGAEEDAGTVGSGRWSEGGGISAVVEHLSATAVGLHPDNARLGRLEIHERGTGSGTGSSSEHAARATHTTNRVPCRSNGMATSAPAAPPRHDFVTRPRNDCVTCHQSR